MWLRAVLTSSSLALAVSCPVFARTGSQLVTDLRIMLGQTDSISGRTNWTNTQLFSILNIAQDKVTARGRVIEKDTVYNGGALRMARPSGFITLRGTAYLMKNNQEVKPIPMTSSDSIYVQQSRMTRQSAGDDTYLIYEESDDIVVSPAAPSAFSVRVVYFANPSAITDSAECSYGDEWETVLLYEAKMLALEKIRDESWYVLTAKERDAILAQMYQQTKLRPQLVKGP